MWPFVDQSNFVVAEITFNDVMTALVVKITFAEQNQRM